MSEFKRGSLRLHYELSGMGPRTLVLQHGLGADLHQVGALYFPPDGVRVVCMDARGHGRSGLGPVDRLGFHAMAGDLVRLLRRLPDHRPIVGGISMGAAISMAAALASPRSLRGLVLIRPAWVDKPMSPDVRALFCKIADLALLEDPPRAERALAGDTDFLTLEVAAPAIALSLREHLHDPEPRRLALLLDRLPRDRPVNDLRQLARIRVPTLVLATERDPIHPLNLATAISRAIPRGELRIVTAKSDDAVAYRNEIQRAIDHFIDRVWTREAVPPAPTGSARSRPVIGDRLRHNDLDSVPGADLL